MRTPRRPSRRQSAAILATAAALAGTAFVAPGSGGDGAGPATGPTATARARDLQVTEAEPGDLARSDTTTVLYDGTGGRVGGGPAGSDVSAQSTGTAVPAVLAQDPEPTTTTTEAPLRLCPPDCTTTSTPAGPDAGGDGGVDGPTDGTAPTGEAPTGEAPTGEAPTGEAPTGETPTGETPTGETPTGEVPTPDDGQPAPDGAATGSSTATLTELLAVGEVATRGTVLYRADDEPIVALLSPTPFFRELRAGVADGPDVQALESELRTLGYTGFTVDEHYDRSTASAVEDWEEDLGRAGPDGVVAVGEVQLLDEPTSVLEHQVRVGDLLEPGDAVLVLGAESRVVEADVDASDAADWAVGTPVEVDWGDGTTSVGSVTAVGREVVDGQVDLVVSLADAAGAERPVGVGVEVLRTVSERTGVVAVPVSAILQGADGPAVRTVRADGDVITPVELGLVDDGWVEVTDGLVAGDEVRLPA